LLVLWSLLDYDAPVSRASRRKRAAIARLPQPSRDAPKPRPATVPRSHRIPFWPGLVVAGICGFVYLAVGSGGTFRFLPSTYVHHTLTAHAWLQGRLYATSDEIAVQYVMNRERRRGHVVPQDQSAGEFLQSYRRDLAASRHSQEPIDVTQDRAFSAAFHDWVRLDDRYYAYWPPLPAALLLPFVWLRGPGVSDVLVGNLLGFASVAFVYLMLRALRSLWPALTTPACAALALAYGLGTCHMYQACFGQVWYLSQLSATLFLIVAICCGLNAVQQPAWMGAAGLALGIAFLGRNTAILSAPFFAVMLWLAVRDSPAWRRRYLVWSAAFGGALVVAIAIQLAFNHARFSDALDFGQGHLAQAGGNPRFAADFERYGRFSVHYLPRNVWYYFLNPLMGSLGGPRSRIDGQPFFDPDGNSLFLVSPFMLYLLRCWQRRDVLLAGVLAGALPGTVALMFFHGTGWFQFGQRYLLDTMPFLLLLAAFGMRGRLTWTAAALILVSIMVNGWGTYRFHLEQP
jgi:hypothetical protein